MDFQIENFLPEQMSVNDNDSPIASGFVSSRSTHMKE